MQAFSDLSLLQELGIPVYTLRPEEPELPNSQNYDFVVVVQETEADFTPAHQKQLQKIMAYLGRAPQEYVLCHAQDARLSTHANVKQFLSFGPGKPEYQTTLQIATHSISEMLKNPACKRQVLNDLQPLKA
jgi:hypothetical protein